MLTLPLKGKKCVFEAQEVKFLGHIISSVGIRMNPEKVEVIRGFESPNTRKKLKQFLGIVNFYHHFFHNIGEVAEPLNHVCSVKSKFIWGPQQQLAFEKIKHQMCEAISLYFSDLSKPFLLHTDSSDFGISGALSQIDETNQPRVISFCSRTLNSAQRNYSTVEKELLAIVFSLEKFREYIDGQKVCLFTDNKVLSYLNSMKNSSQRLMRWAWKIQEYSPDFISRNPLPDSQDNERYANYMFPPINKSCLAVQTNLNLKRLQEAQLTDSSIINFIIRFMITFCISLLQI